METAMSSMPAGPDTLLDQQRTVQRKLGCCLLRLQQYEILLKALFVQAGVAGAPAELQAVLEATANSVQKATLGTLVSILCDRHLTSDADDCPKDTMQGDAAPWFRIRAQMRFSAKDYESTVATLRELVDLRNELVHHFLQRFNIGNAEGCIAAVSYLDASFDTIDGHFLKLRRWATDIEGARAFFASSGFEDFLVNGIAPDGSVHWPINGAVGCLREAESRFAADGWMALNTAIAWIRQEYPDQTPQRYGCASWRQIIHESGQFLTRKSINGDTGCREVWFRSHQHDIATARS